jgi:hypothetical protein
MSMANCGTCSSRHLRRDVTTTARRSTRNRCSMLLGPRASLLMRQNNRVAWSYGIWRSEPQVDAPRKLAALHEASNRQAPMDLCKFSHARPC